MMFALPTEEAPRFSDKVFAPLDAERFSKHQCLGQFATGQLENSPQGLPGNIHRFGGHFLIEALVIDQANRFVFIDRQPDLLQILGSDAGGLEKLARRLRLDLSFSGGSCHRSLLVSSKAYPNNHGNVRVGIKQGTATWFVCGVFRSRTGL
jgi:hypothetical protein